MPAGTAEEASVQVRGSFAGTDLQEIASNLRRLAHAFEAFNNHAPGTFFDTETLREMAVREDEP